VQVHFDELTELQRQLKTCLRPATALLPVLLLLLLLYRPLSAPSHRLLLLWLTQLLLLAAMQLQRLMQIESDPQEQTKQLLGL
jgi:hypothetical protein